jgi:hypothetical protein
MNIKDFFLSILSESSPLFMGEFERLKLKEMKLVEELKGRPEFERIQCPYFSNTNFKLKKNYLDLLLFKVKRSTDNSIHTFINKQTEKLNKVIKDNHIKNITLLGSGIDHVEIAIIFSNNKELKVRTQLVEVIEKKKVIQRYPTTFHDIKINDEIFKTKSHEWLVKNF